MLACFRCLARQLHIDSRLFWLSVLLGCVIPVQLHRCSPKRLPFHGIQLSRSSHPPLATGDIYPLAHCLGAKSINRWATIGGRIKVSVFTHMLTQV
jgi:hypothetical protein